MGTKKSGLPGLFFQQIGLAANNKQATITVGTGYADSMALIYRKAINSQVWHFSAECSTWPTSNYIESESSQQPEDGQLCSECAALRTLAK